MLRRAQSYATKFNMKSLVRDQQIALNWEKQQKKREQKNIISLHERRKEVIFYSASLEKEKEAATAREREGKSDKVFLSFSSSFLLHAPKFWRQQPCVTFLPVGKLVKVQNSD